MTNYHARKKYACDFPLTLASRKSWLSTRLHPINRHLPLYIVPLPHYSRIATFLLTLCSSFSQVSILFTFILTCAHLFSLKVPIFHSHFLITHHTHAILFSFWSHFFHLSHHGTISRAKFPLLDDDGFVLFTSFVQCASHNTSSSTQIQ